MKRTNNIQEFMTYVLWKELDINEKQALYNAIEAEDNVNYGLFEVNRDANLEFTEVKCVLYDILLVVSDKARHEFLRWLEKNYMHGEDGHAYLDWLQEIEEDDSREHLIKETTIRMLPLEEAKVIKKITIAYKARTQIHYAVVMYARKLSDIYNVKSENCQIIKDAVGQEYPQDVLDYTILRLIKVKFRDAKLSSEYQIFDADRTRLEHIARNMRSMSILFSIEHLTYSECPNYQVTFNLSCYCTRKETERIFKNQEFHFDIKDTQIYQQLTSLVKETLVPIF